MRVRDWDNAVYSKIEIKLITHIAQKCIVFLVLYLLRVGYNNPKTTSHH